MTGWQLCSSLPRLRYFYKILFLGSKYCFFPLRVLFLVFEGWHLWNPIFRLLMQFECIEKHIFSGISDYFRLFVTDALTSLLIITELVKTRFHCNMIHNWLYMQTLDAAPKTIYLPPNFFFYMMHHTVPRGTALCSTTLRPPGVKSCRIILCVVQREHNVENRCDLLGLKCFQRLLSMQFIQNKSFQTLYCAFCKDILHFLNPNTAPENKIIEQNGGFLLGTPGYGLCHHIHVKETYVRSLLHQHSEEKKLK